MENVELKERFIDKKTGIEYIRCGNYYLPNLIMSMENTNYQIGKYGKMKLKYLKNHKKAEYFNLLMDCKLNRYLHEIDIACNNRINAIISKLAKQENVTEECNVEIANVDGFLTDTESLKNEYRPTRYVNSSQIGPTILIIKMAIRG